MAAATVTQKKGAQFKSGQSVIVSNLNDANMDAKQRHHPLRHAIDRQLDACECVLHRNSITYKLAIEE